MSVKTTSRFIISVATVALLLCVSLSMSPPIRARYLFKQMEALNVGHTNFDEAQHLATKLGGTPGGSCNRTECQWRMDVNNAKLPQWWRGAGVTFGIGFDVKDDVVDYKGAWYAIGIVTDGVTPSMVSAGVKEKWLLWRAGMPEFVEPPTARGGSMSYFENNCHREKISFAYQVRMTPRSSAEEWRRYTAFNYGCFWKYKGCKNASDLLSTVERLPEDR